MVNMVNCAKPCSTLSKWLFLITITALEIWMTYTLYCPRIVPTLLDAQCYFLGVKSLDLLQQEIWGISRGLYPLSIWDITPSEVSVSEAFDPYFSDLPAVVVNSFMWALSRTTPWRFLWSSWFMDIKFVSGCECTIFFMYTYWQWGLFQQALKNGSESKLVTDRIKAGYGYMLDDN